MEGLGYLLTPELPAPDDTIGTLFTSLRVWQLRREDEFERERADAARVKIVAKAIAPAAAFEEFRREYEQWEKEELPEELEADAADFGDEDFDPESVVEYLTIVEGVTPLVEVPDSDPPSAPYDRVVDAIADLLRAYRLASRTPIAPVTRERLPFSTYFLTRNPLPPSEWSHGMLLTHFNPPGGRSIPPIGPEQLEHLNAHLGAAQRRTTRSCPSQNGWRTPNTRSLSLAIPRTLSSWRGWGSRSSSTATLKLLLLDEQLDVEAAAELGRCH